MPEEVCIIMVIVCALSVWYFLKHFNPEDVPEEEFRYTFYLHECIQKAAEIDRQIQLIDDMLINIDTADHDRLRNMVIRWDWSGQLPQETAFCVSEKETAQAMRDLALVKRQQLVDSLSEELRKMPERWGQNKDITECEGIDSAGNVDAPSADKTEPNLINAAVISARRKED